MIDIKTEINSPIGTDSIPEDAINNAELIEELFDMVEDNLVPGSSASFKFVGSLYDWWIEKGFLTKDQFAKLEEMSEE